jgi:hypothetical protein
MEQQQPPLEGKESPASPQQQEQEQEQQQQEQQQQEALPNVTSKSPAPMEQVAACVLPGVVCDFDTPPVYGAKEKFEISTTLTGGWNIDLKATNHIPDWVKGEEMAASELFYVQNKRDWVYSDYHTEVNIKRNAFSDKTYGFALDHGCWLAVFDLMQEDLEKHATKLATSVANTWNKINGPYSRRGLRQVNFTKKSYRVNKI